MSLRPMQYQVLHKNVQVEAADVKRHAVPIAIGVLKTEADPNRSPLGSPPIEKKRLRRLSNATNAVEKENVEPSVVKSKGSILKKRGAKLTPGKCSHNKGVQFSANVLVQYIGDKDVTREALREGQDRMAFIARNLMRKNSGGDDHHQGYLPSSSSTTQLPTFQENPIYKAPEQQQRPGKSVSISFTQSNRGATLMKFQVFMGPQYDPDNIVVKANMSGNRLRVVASKVSKYDSAAKEEYNERFQLPMQVDPYKVEARLDSRGYLTVDAPLMSNEQKRAIEQKSVAANSP